MTVDEKIDAAADKLEAAAEKTAGGGGVKRKLADELATDADFLRKLKPSLMKARLKGDAPTDGKPGERHVSPSGPQLAKSKPRGGGPNPWLVIGAALAVGYGLAKILDWRGHAHPRR